MKKMLKRADGSTSQRGLWDNIRANKGSGKKPTKEMLKQEAKIKSKKKTGGNWLQESKELKFGGPTKKYQLAGASTLTPAQQAAKAAEREAMSKELGMIKDPVTGKWSNPPKTAAPAQEKSFFDSMYEGLSSMFSGPSQGSGPSEEGGIRRKTGGKKKMGGKNC